MISGRLKMSDMSSVLIAGQRLTIEDICAVAEQTKTVKLSGQSDFIKRIDKLQAGTIEPKNTIAMGF